MSRTGRAPTERPSGSPLLRAYIALVVVVAMGGFVVVAFLDPTPTRVDSLDFLLLATFVVVSEVVPLRVIRNGREGLLTVSTTFAFAILLWLGGTEAIIPLVLGSVLHDLLQRKTAQKAVFNAAQLTLSVIAAGLSMQLVVPRTGEPPFPLEQTGAVAILVAALAFFLTNFVLSGAAVALASNVSPSTLLRRDLGPQALWTGVLLSMSPIVVATAEVHVLLLPLFAVPMGIIYRAMDVMLRRAHEALHDGLTGLPNRALFEDRVHQAALTAQRTGDQAAVLILDVDDFKNVNDTLGHRAGDEVLQTLAERLTHVLRNVDTVARLGGDEFGVVLNPVDGQEHAIEVARQIRSTIHEPLPYGHLVMGLEASVGVALVPAHGVDPGALITYADAAMFEAKRLKSGWELHEPRRFEQGEHRITRLSRLRQALADGGLELHYQPKLRLDDGSVDGIEALVRWHDPERGFISPDQFVPLAEESGLIRELTGFVLETAIKQITVLRSMGIPHRIAVNIAARDLQDPLLPDQIAQLLSAHDVEPRWLELEITERTIMSNPRQAHRVAMRLHELGVMLTIDDFGTGNTSLAVLTRLPVDCLKIDRSLVSALESGGPDAVIVEATVKLSQNLGLMVVAEGVETESMWRQLVEIGCDTAQGYYCSRPLPAEELTALLVSPG